MTEAATFDRQYSLQGLAASILFHCLLLVVFWNVRGPGPALLKALPPEPIVVISQQIIVPEDARVPPAAPSRREISGTIETRGMTSSFPPPLPSAKTPVMQEPVQIPSNASPSGIAIDNGGGSEGQRQGDGISGLAQALPKPTIEPEAPNWIRKPTPDQMILALPRDVAEMREPGSAVLSCLVTPANRVRDCKVVSQTWSARAFEAPYGYGTAAMRLSRTFLVKPPVRDGQPKYDIRVRIPLQWLAN